MLPELRSRSYLSNPEANTGSKISIKVNPQISQIIREISKGKLEVGIIKGSILMISLMCSRMISTMLLASVEALLNVLRVIFIDFEPNLLRGSRDRDFRKIGEIWLSERRVLRTHL